MTAITLQQEQPAPHAGVNQWQQRVKMVRASGRKVILASLGLGAYVVDGVAAASKRSAHLFTSAEQRGQRMSRGMRRRFNDLEEQAVGEMRKLQEQVGGTAGSLPGDTAAAKATSNADVEKRVELALAAMGLPSRERLARLSEEIDALNQKLDQELMRLPNDPIPDPLG